MPTAISGWERVGGTGGTTDSNGPKTATVDCTGTKKVLGGGYELSGGTANGMDLTFYDNRPLDDNTWTVTANETNNTNSTWSIRAWAICAPTSP